MEFQIQIDGHTFVLEKSETKWAAKSHVVGKRVVVEFYIPEDGDEDKDFIAWHDRIIELLSTADLPMHVIRHLGASTTEETID